MGLELSSMGLGQALERFLISVAGGGQEHRQIRPVTRHGTDGYAHDEGSSL
jgi:hypothetical protein